MVEELDQSLRRIIGATPWFMRALIALRSVSAPEAHIGSGAIRNVVWDALHGYSKPSFLADIDVAYFDPNDLSDTSEKRLERQLNALEPDVTWDVKNQAAVHLWFHKVFGHDVEPLHCMEDAVATWPETALAVAVRLRPDGTIAVMAPLGLEDLFSMLVRRNPRRVSIETYEQRLADKNYPHRWPKVRIVHDINSATGRISRRPNTVRKSET